MDRSPIDTARTRLKEARKQVTITTQVVEDEPQVERILREVREGIVTALVLLEDQDATVGTPRKGQVTESDGSGVSHSGSETHRGNGNKP